MSLRERASSIRFALLILVLALVGDAGCTLRTRRVGRVGVVPAPAAPSEPPAVEVRPLSVAELARDPLRGLVLGAGGPGRARPVHLLGRPHWVEVDAHLANDAEGWGRFWLVARPTQVGPAQNPVLPPAQAPPPPPAASPGANPAASADRTPDPGSPASPPPPQTVEPVGPAFAGPGWTRVLWAAKLAATATLGKNPLDVDLAAISQGTELEPPGAATLAVATLAALTGARFAPAAVVVAELEPDGSLAPVADPIDQVQSALRRGARRVILPIGGGTAALSSDGRAVDLLQLVRRAGGKAWLAPDVARAYGFVTSAPLPEPEAVETDVLALAADEESALEIAYRRALERVAVVWPLLVEQQNRARLPSPVAALLGGAQRGARRAERWRAAGARAAAYVLLTDAAALADAAARLDQVLRFVAAGDLSRARAELDRAREEPPSPPWIPPGEVAPVTIGAHLRAASLSLAAANSWAWSEEATARAKQARAALDPPAGSDRAQLSGRAFARSVAEGVAPLLVASARARMYADLVHDRASLELRAGPRFAANLDTLRALAAADAAAAAATLEVLDRAMANRPQPGPVSGPSSASSPGSSSGSESVSGPRSRSGSASASGSGSVSGPRSRSGSASASGSGSAADSGPSSGAASESPWPSPASLPPEVVVARRLLTLVDSDGELKRRPGSSRVPAESAPLLALFAARQAFAGVAHALVRARRLRPGLDPWTGEVVTVKSPSSLRDALAGAESALRRQAASARVAIGSIPFGARLAYQAAAALARGDRPERVVALELYQAASAQCQLAVLLALSAEAAPTPALGSAGERAGCPPSPSAHLACR